jgi:hypothetical protein
MRKILITLALIPILCGCTGFDLKKYDPITKAQIEITVAHEKADYSAVLDALTDLSAPEIVINDLKARYESELDRLEKWLAYESAKQLEDEPKVEE